MEILALLATIIFGGGTVLACVLGIIAIVLVVAVVDIIPFIGIWHIVWYCNGTWDKKREQRKAKKEAKTRVYKDIQLTDNPELNEDPWLNAPTE